MSHPIPQMVDISHALQSTTIEKIRSDIKGFQQVSELSPHQSQTVNNYIESLRVAFAQFTKDNEHVERGDESITAGDTQLYLGLKAMYSDYLTQLTNIKKEKTQGDEEADEDNPLEYITEELPYLQPTERKKYIDNVMLSSKYDKLLKNSQELLNAMVNLCLLDSTVTYNLRSYLTLLNKMGFTNETLKKELPESILGLSTSSSGTTPNTSSAIISPGTVGNAKKISTDREGTPPLTATNNSSEDDVLNNLQEQRDGSDDEPKKKISFSKYLKKGDVVINENGKRKTPSSLVREEFVPTKKVKNDSVDASLNSILKTNGSNKKNTNNIKFVDDSQLVRVYGEGLPDDGLNVSPEQLKKILKPFKAGEPREIAYIEGYSGKAPELDMEFDLSPEESDISETKGGPIPCDTVVPLKYKINFTNFTSDLGNKPAREPVIPDESLDISKKNKVPLIVRAFGKNSLLLRKDRGGLPYKRIPEVSSINYPPRAID